KFTVGAGQKVFFDSQGVTGGTGTWKLLDPFGNVVFGPNNLVTDIDTLTLTVPGTYTLAIEGVVSNTTPVTYSFNVQPVTDTTQALTIGTTVNGNINITGKQDHYTFTLNSPTQLTFDSFTNNPQLNWSLDGPRGNEANRGFQSSDGFNGRVVVMLPTGAYTLTVDGNGDNTGAYSFRLLDLSTATAITPGTPVTNATLNPGNETDLYKFTVGAGQKVFFDSQGVTGGT